MASAKHIDVNVISRNSANGKNRLVGLTIDKIVVVYKNASNVTVVKYKPDNDNHSSMNPVRYKVLETLNNIIVKANNADFNNGLIQLIIREVNGRTLPTAKTMIINRDKIKNMTPVYNDAGAVTGTKIKYENWYLIIWEVSENLVVNTSSS